jgi:FkbM family methyltransferase
MGNVIASLKRFIPWDRIARYRVRGHIARHIASRGVISKTTNGLLRIELTRSSEPHATLLVRDAESDLFVFYQVFVLEEYAPLLSLLSSRGEIEQIRTIVDAGANIGCTTVYLGMNFPNAQVVCIEPDPATFSALEATLAANARWLRAEALHAALWHTETTLALDRNFRDGQSWSTRVTSGDGGSTQNSVRAVTLAHTRDKLPGGRIDILKIDVEGAEHSLMASPDFFDELSEVRYIAMEIHQDIGPIEPILTKLTAAGFQYVIASETVFAFRERVAA